MKKWKRGAALLAALGLSLNLLGCGSSTPSGVQQSSPEQGTPPPVAEEVEPEEVVEPEPEPEPEPSSEDAETSARPASKETQLTPKVPVSKEIKGLIVMRANVSNPVSDLDRFLITDGLTIYSLDPDTGTTSQIITFSIKPFASGRTFTWFPNNTENVGHWFAPDYTKLCAGCQIDSTGDQHAGWIDNDGDFFDVTEAVGMARQGDFGGRVDQEAFGITDDGMFVFDDWGGVYPRRTSKRTTYYVPIDDVRPETVREGQPFVVAQLNRNIIEPFSNGKYLRTDGHWSCIITDDPESLSGTKFVPESDRENWSPLASPDRGRIAFMSQPSKGNEPADIFITAPEGRNPTRVPNHDFSLGRMGGFSNILQGGDSILLDWR